jgi:hypothetical protein
VDSGIISTSRGSVVGRTDRRISFIDLSGSIVALLKGKGNSERMRRAQYAVAKVSQMHD